MPELPAQRLTCREIVELLTDYLERTLPPDERARVDEHLATCAGCTAYLEQLRTTIGVLRRLHDYDPAVVRGEAAPGMSANGHRTTRRTSLLAALALALPAPAGAAPATRDVLVVGNNWDGTAAIVDPHTHEVLTRLNIVPDLAQRMAEIAADPAATAFLLGIGLLIGEGHDQYVDDAFTSPDGRACTSRGRASPTSSPSTSGHGRSSGG